MTYDTAPVIPSGSESLVASGYDGIGVWGRTHHAELLLIDTYPGVRDSDAEAVATALGAKRILRTESALWPPDIIREMTEPDLGSDPVFGRLTRLSLRDFFDPGKLEALREEVAASCGSTAVIGPGASLAASSGLLLYADLGRREATLRQRTGEAGNLGLRNGKESASLKYKRSYFVDWRVADRHKRSLWERIEAFVDTTSPVKPVLVSRKTLSAALAAVATRPFRVEPWFDPAPWGGSWIQEHIGIGGTEPNLGWCFDCVPEENSLLLGFGTHVVNIPSLDLVFREPRQLLGNAVYGRFGAEFPIRTDFLDTMGGGNLSLQVHPLAGYMLEHFGHAFTQDESYYILDAKQGASVHLGLHDGADPAAFTAAIRDAERGVPFPHEKYVNVFPTRKHDHFLIPAGTLHGSAANTMVLEISATPYIFTFKMYDWLRPDLSGNMRPLHIDRALDNFQWERDSSFCTRELVNRFEKVASGDGWTEEHTGLHSTEFIETRRHWFSKPAPHASDGGVAVINLVEGESATVESPESAFEPFTVHHAETFILPAGAGDYVIRPGVAGKPHATIKAYVRTKG